MAEVSGDNVAVSVSFKKRQREILQEITSLEFQRAAIKQKTCDLQHQASELARQMRNPAIVCLVDALLPQPLIDICVDYNGWEICAGCNLLFWTRMKCLNCIEPNDTRRFTTYGDAFMTCPCESFSNILFANELDQGLWNYIQTTIGSDVEVVFDVLGAENAPTHMHHFKDRQWNVCVELNVTIDSPDVSPSKDLDYDPDIVTQVRVWSILITPQIAPLSTLQKKKRS